jgi:hypothetical protein
MLVWIPCPNKLPQAFLPLFKNGMCGMHVCFFAFSVYHNYQYVWLMISGGLEKLFNVDIKHACI